MALSDILDAITLQTNHRILEMQQSFATLLSEKKAALQREHTLRMDVIKAASQKDLHHQKQGAVEKARMQKNSIILKAKHELLDELYEAVINVLCELSQEKQQELFFMCLKELPKDGILHPTKMSRAMLAVLAKQEQYSLSTEDASGRGGFVYESSKMRADFRYETLVKEYIRPRTQVQVLEELFL